MIRRITHKNSPLLRANVDEFDEWFKKSFKSFIDTNREVNNPAEDMALFLSSSEYSKIIKEYISRGYFNEKGFNKETTKEAAESMSKIQNSLNAYGVPMRYISNLLFKIVSATIRSSEPEKRDDLIERLKNLNSISNKFREEVFTLFDNQSVLMEKDVSSCKYHSLALYGWRYEIVKSIQDSLRAVLLEERSDISSMQLTDIKDEIKSGSLYYLALGYLSMLETTAGIDDFDDVTIMLKLNHKADLLYAEIISATYSIILDVVTDLNILKFEEFEVDGSLLNYVTASHKFYTTRTLSFTSIRSIKVRRDRLMS